MGFFYMGNIYIYIYTHYLNSLYKYVILPMGKNLKVCRAQFSCKNPPALRRIFTTTNDYDFI